MIACTEGELFDIREIPRSFQVHSPLPGGGQFSVQEIKLRISSTEGSEPKAKDGRIGAIFVSSSWLLPGTHMIA
jgi:hypothetical protein